VCYDAASVLPFRSYFSLCLAQCTFLQFILTGFLPVSKEDIRKHYWRKGNSPSYSVYDIEWRKTLLLEIH